MTDYLRYKSVGLLSIRLEYSSSPDPAKRENYGTIVVKVSSHGVLIGVRSAGGRPHPGRGTGLHARGGSPQLQTKIKVGAMK